MFDLPGYYLRSGRPIWGVFLWRLARCFWAPPCLCWACSASRCSQKCSSLGCAFACTGQRSPHKSCSWVPARIWAICSTPWTLGIPQGGPCRVLRAKFRFSCFWCYCTFRFCFGQAILTKVKSPWPNREGHGQLFLNRLCATARCPCELR